MTQHDLNHPVEFSPMSEQEFARAYIAAHERAGDYWSTLDVVRSWHNYQKDPAGHFLSKPVVTVKEAA